MINAVLLFLDKETSSLTQAATSATPATNALFVTDLPSPSAEEYRLVMCTFFAILFTIVTQIDSVAVEQNYLVQLVLSIRRLPLPATVKQGIGRGDLDSNMNHDLAKFVNVWSNLEANASVHPPL